MRTARGLPEAMCAAKLPRRSAIMTWGPSARYWSGVSAGMFTALMAIEFRRYSTTCSAMRTPTISCASSVEPQRAILVGRQRRHVHGVDGDRVPQVFDHLFGDAHADDFLRFLGRAADVGGGDDCVGFEEREAGRRRFHGENVD